MKNRSGIPRRSFLGAAGGMMLGGRMARPATAPAQPNILLIMTDQQRYDALSCTGLTAIRTSNLDRLASQGTLFETCYANNPICTPSRASMMTGKSLPGHGVYRLYDTLPPSEVLFTKRLQNAGYRTALFGKLHVSGRLYEAQQRHPNDGFDVYEWCLETSIHLDSPWNGYAKWLRQQDPPFYQRLQQLGRKLTHIPRERHFTHWAAERTIDFIRTTPAGRPFFCLMSVFDPHNPYDGYPDEMAKLVDERRIADPFIPKRGMQGRPYAVRHEHQHSHIGPFSSFSRDDLRRFRFGYYASIALADLEIGRVLQALEERGLAENTLVIFTSDHGDMLGDQQLMVKGAFFYDPSVRVPLIMRWPARLRPGRRIRDVVQLNDLASTVLSAAGCLSPEMQREMPESQDLLALIDGGSRHRDYAVCCYRNSGIHDNGYADPPIHATMLRDRRYKLNVFHSPKPPGSTVEGELYDMEEDPREAVDLWNDPAHHKTREAMTEQLFAWVASQELLLGSRAGEIVPAASQKVDNRLR